MIHYAGRLTAGRFLRRDNRFLMQVQVGRRIVPAAVPTTGRLTELLIPGARVWLQPAAGPERKTPYTCELVEAPTGVLVSLNTHRVNCLVQEAMEYDRLPTLRGWIPDRREVVFGDSRFDIAGTCAGGRWLMEVKSVTLVEQDAGLFPDALTTRGCKHMATLQQAVRDGYAAAAVFCIAREDASKFRPHAIQDPAFTKALQNAAGAGVVVIACRCRVTLEGMEVTGEVPVEIDHENSIKK